MSFTKKTPRPIEYRDGGVFVPLTRGKYARIDPEDAEEIGKYNWFFKGGYAQRKISVWFGSWERGYFRPMQNEVMRDPIPEWIWLPEKRTQRESEKVVDHKSRDSLDNRRENLRFANAVQSGRNRDVPVGKSGFRGVRFDPKSKRNPWRADIKIAGKYRSLGKFPTAELANEARRKAEAELFGEFSPRAKELALS